MKRALVLFHSRTGTTAAYGEEIAGELIQNGVDARALPLYKASNSELADADTLFIGCWTSGLLFFMQHPEKAFVNYLDNISDLTNKKIVLFTTYKILTGSMFRSMSRHLPGTPEISRVRMRSRTGRLSKDDKGRIHILAAL
jgi:flavodoxin